MELLKQGANRPLPVEKQVVSIYTAARGYLDDIPIVDVLRFEQKFIDYLDHYGEDILKSIRETEDLTVENEERLKETIIAFIEGFETTV